MSGRDRAPTKAEVISQIRRLLSRDCDRSAIADWARPWVATRADEVDDLRILRALESIASADLPTTDREFLYGREDFAAWLEEIED